MKSLKYIFMAMAVSLSMASCMDGDDGLFDNDWKEPDTSTLPFGNNDITEDNVITIAQLKAIPAYATAISNGKYEQIKEDLKLKVRVSGNDLAGNIYKQVAVQDATGGIIIGINKAGLCGYMAEGQEMLVALKDLYIGGYGGAPQIGAPYNGGIGRMAESVWMNHFKLIGTPEPKQVKPIEVTANTLTDDMIGKLIVMKNVTFKNANGTQTLITGKRESATSNYYHQELDQFPSSVVIRTSTYADFAATILPFDTKTGTKKPVNIIGIASKYNSTWQIMIRKTSDITFEDVETADPMPDTPSADAPQGDGTFENPFNVAAVLQYTNSLKADEESAKDIYVKGVISEVKEEYSTNFGNGTFYITDPGSGVTFYVYRALHLGNKKYTEGATQIKVGDEVLICGRVVNYKGNTPETAQNKAYIYSLNGKTE